MGYAKNKMLERGTGLMWLFSLIRLDWNEIRHSERWAGGSDETNGTDGSGVVDGYLWISVAQLRFAPASIDEPPPHTGYRVGCRA